MGIINSSMFMHFCPISLSGDSIRSKEPWVAISEGRVGEDAPTNDGFGSWSAGMSDADGQYASIGRWSLLDGYKQQQNVIGKLGIIPGSWLEPSALDLGISWWWMYKISARGPGESGHQGCHRAKRWPMGCLLGCLWLLNGMPNGMSSLVCNSISSVWGWPH